MLEKYAFAYKLTKLLKLTLLLTIREFSVVCPLTAIELKNDVIFEKFAIPETDKVLFMLTLLENVAVP